MNRCVNCGINRVSSTGDTCPSKKHTGALCLTETIEKRVDGSAYHTHAVKWSCCNGRCDYPPCQTVPHSFSN